MTTMKGRKTWKRGYWLCQVCRLFKPSKGFAHVVTYRCCEDCTPILREASAKAMKRFVDKFVKAQTSDSSKGAK
jgi:hypothetical protein